MKLTRNTQAWRRFRRLLKCYTNTLLVMNMPGARMAADLEYEEREFLKAKENLEKFVETQISQSIATATKQGIGAERHEEWWDKGYMTPLHPDAFKDLKKMPPQIGLPYECLRCKGYGRWNLRLNEYPSQEVPYCHFRANCNNCNGWGYTEESNHVHTWKESEGPYPCSYLRTCAVCGKIQLVDSSG